MALFKTFSDAAERLTACIYTLLIGAHGPHFIGRVYLCKGYIHKIGGEGLTSTLTLI